MSVVSFLQDLVRIDTTPGNEEQGVLRAAEEMRHLDFDDVAIDPHGNLIGRVGPAGGRTLVVDGHIDTVPVYTPEAWHHDPLGAEIADGHIYGRGTADMKAAVAAFIYGGGELKRSAGAGLGGCVLLVVSIAEEMREGATLARTFQGRRADWCIIGEPTGLSIAHAQRGRARIGVEVWGRSVHSATSSDGINAVELMTDVLRRTKELPSPTHPGLGTRDINLIDIRSEPYPSISTIPDYCVARFDVRFLPGESRESLLSLMQGLLPEGRGRVQIMPAVFTAYTGAHYELEDMALSWETPPSHELVEKALEATGAELDTYPFCTNGSYFAGERGIATIGYGPGAAAQAHAVDESVPVTEVEQAAHGYRSIFASILGGP